MYKINVQNKYIVKQINNSATYLLYLLNLFILCSLATYEYKWQRI